MAKVWLWYIGLPIGKSILYIMDDGFFITKIYWAKTSLLPESDRINFYGWYQKPLVKVLVQMKNVARFCRK